MQRRQFLRNTLLTGATLPALVACLGSNDRNNDGQTTLPGEQVRPERVDQLIAPQAFVNGVASGDPSHDQLIVWTALTPATREQSEDIPVSLEYVVGAEWMDDDDAWPTAFATPAQVKKLGFFLAKAARDYTIKVDLGNVELYRGTRFGLGELTALPPASVIYYRFRAGSQVSRIGRARTLGVGDSVQQARFAVTSCSNFPAGLFSVYEMVSQQEDLDFVVHLGDYIYEYGEGQYADVAGLNRIPEPPHEMISCEDYVLRHAQYKRDPQLQRLHARYPMIVVWDDHEITNDAWREGAENHTEGAEGNYAERLGFAIRAYFNWMPLREQFARDSITLVPDAREVIYRRIRVGSLLDMIMLDTRIVGRDEQASLPAIDPSRNDANRSLLGDQQRQWLQLKLLEAKNQGATWTFLGQQVMFGQLNLVELPAVKLLGQQLLGNLVALNNDQWDGYTAERNRIREFVKAIGLQNLVVLTGDIHTSWAIELYENPFILLGDRLQKPFGVEFVTPSVTSPGFPDEVADLVSTVIPVANPHIKYSELKTKGYLLVDVTRERTTAQWRYAASITDPNLIGEERVNMRKTFQVLAGSNRLQAISA
ncbi:MAG: alkaline phosphatase D family protein [Moraxellaceae bacterium]|nr:alkaline phosphatase D family protein [Moraxellaceae bacterium]MDZ4386364.1 alkaline phosphatase D family protein [Moraxellaceae bacterium]